jgi:hypothetical protein
MILLYIFHVRYQPQDTRVSQSSQTLYYNYWDFTCRGLTSTGFDLVPLGLTAFDEPLVLALLLQASSGFL